MTVSEDKEDSMAQTAIEGRTAQWRLYRRLSSSGYRNTLSELLRANYNPLRVQEGVNP